MKSKLLRFNWVMFVSMLALMAIGTLFIWSAGNARAEAVFHDIWKANLVTGVVGLAIYALLAFCDYRQYLAYFAVPAYAVALLLLVAVLLFGSTIYGGRRWLWFFQPSEISKVCILGMLAWLFGGEDVFAWQRGFRGLVLAALIVGVPALLILLEPDLGTMLTLVPATLLMLLVARVWRRGLLTAVLVLVTLGATVLGAVYEAEKPGVSAERRDRIMRWVPLKHHQVQRVKVFLFPESDARGAGYTLRQAMISIGSGGFSGKGVGKGETNHLKYLPQAISMNDFIFCVYAEETGFVGSMVLLTLFGILLISCVVTAFYATDGRGRLLALGVSMLIFAHVFINIAMSIGMVPITGLPLPFISSGRTFLVTLTVGLGLVQSVAIHGRETKV